MEPIKIWKFEDAPKALRDLSSRGGHEDLLILIPPEYEDMELFSSFEIEEIKIKDSIYKGYTILIQSE